MNGRCNELSLDEGALMAALTETAKQGLLMEGEALLAIMRAEAGRTTNGGAPGKPEWRREIAGNLNHVATAVAGDGISMDFGYSPAGLADEVRAMVVNEGSGSAAGGAAIHAGPTGRSVWDSELSGRHPSRAKTEYDLPEGFNQKGNRFVENAVRRMQTRFGDRLEAVFAAEPDSTYYGNVHVHKR